MNYKKKTDISTPLFSEEELIQIEQDNAEGLSLAEIVDICSGRGLKLSEATFRKYVQLGLLPRSRRIGTKGKHKGSRGVYPAGTVRQIVDIKQMMALDYTIEEIRQHFAFVGGEIEELRTLLFRILEQLEKSLMSVDEHEAMVTDGLRLQIVEARESAEDLVTKLETAAARIRLRRQTAREAV